MIDTRPTAEEAGEALKNLNLAGTNTKELEKFLDVIKKGKLAEIFGTVDIQKIAEMTTEEIVNRLDTSFCIGDQVRDAEGDLYVCVFKAQDELVFVGKDYVFADNQANCGELVKTGKVFFINKEGWFE